MKDKEYWYCTGERSLEYIEGLKSLEKTPATRRMKNGDVITHYGTHVTIEDKDGNPVEPKDNLMKFVDFKNVKYKPLKGNEISK